MSNPASMALLDLNGAVADVLKVNNIQPDIWLKNPYGDKKDMMMLADAENEVMAAGQPLAGTEDATTEHTMVHLMFTKTEEFKNLSPQNQQLIMDHIMQEHDANHQTGQSADLMNQYGLAPNPNELPSPGVPPVAAPITLRPAACEPVDESTLKAGFVAPNLPSLSS